MAASLNNCHQKLFILLKKVNSTHLKPICDNMSSFIMKNILYWIAEESEPEMFTPNTLLHFLIKSLSKLRKALQCGYLSYFMIPERNILFKKTTESQMKLLLKKLDQLIDEGPKCVLNLSIISQSLCQRVTERKRMGQVRDKMEILKLELWRIRAQVYEQGMSEKDIIDRAWQQEGYEKAQIELVGLLNPDWKDAFIEEVLAENINMDVHRPEEREHIQIVGKAFLESDFTHFLNYLCREGHIDSIPSYNDESVINAGGRWCLLLVKNMQ